MLYLQALGFFFCEPKTLLFLRIPFLTSRYTATQELLREREQPELAWIFYHVVTRHYTAAVRLLKHRASGEDVQSRDLVLGDLSRDDNSDGTNKLKSDDISAAGGTSGAKLLQRRRVRRTSIHEEALLKGETEPKASQNLSHPGGSRVVRRYHSSDLEEAWKSDLRRQAEADLRRQAEEVWME